MRSAIVLLLGIILVGCSSVAPAATAALTVAPSIPTLSAPASALPTPAPTEVQTEIPTAIPASPTAFVPFNVKTWADNVLLRSNPGYLFPKLARLDDGTVLRVLGRSRGGEWLLVQTPDNQVGWVFTQLVETETEDPRLAPEMSPPDTQLVTGQVRDTNGNPVSGIQFAIVQGTDPNMLRTDAMTDETGIFYAFMPTDASGTWWVSYTAISCKSNIMDADCNWVGKPSPEGMYVELPRSTAEPLEFEWQ